MRLLVATIVAATAVALSPLTENALQPAPAPQWPQAQSLQSLNGAAALSRAQSVIDSDPRTKEVLRNAADDVARNPGQQRALATLMGLMQRESGLQAVMGAVQELIRGQRDGPGMHAVGAALGLSSFPPAPMVELDHLPERTGDPAVIG